MKKYICAFIILIAFAACAGNKKVTVNNKYDILEDKGKKMLSGFIERKLLQNDTAFAWFKENMQYGNPVPFSIDAFQQQKNKFTMLVFGSTWCEDTQNLWPKFFQLIDKSGYPEQNITLVALDRKKQSNKDDSLHVTYHITNVPTFIVLQNGKEMGRVTEYGTLGDITRELGQIVAALK